MNPLPSMLPLSFFLFFLMLLPPYAMPFDELYLNCNATYICGGLDITYPFREIGGGLDYCGHPDYEVECEEGDNNLTMMIGGQKYQVLDIIEEKQSLTVVRMDVLEESICDAQQIISPLDNRFKFTDDDLNVTLLSNCPMLEPSSELHEISCRPEQSGAHYYLNLTQPPTDFLPPRCHKVIPMLKSAAQNLTSKIIDAAEALERGFEVNWTLNTTECLACLNSKGACGYNTTLGKFSCFCIDGAHQGTCLGPRQMEAPPRGSNWKSKLGIAAGAIGGTAIFMSAAFFLITRYRSRRKQKQSSYLVSRSISSHYSSRTDLERGGGAYYGPIFEYDELKNATNNFDPEKELGDGGFGTVFYGKLKDGRDVAVKRLYEHNYKRTEQFMNEVKILGGLYHPNLVCLYGCTSRSSHRLLLVYEYVSNGTVADHLYGDLAKPGSLPWSIRMNIAIETASALVYLHAKGIVHRDVKTNNILLDEHFKVKVADFGLSRLFPLNATHVSTAPQGTPGYVDPEYHECYQLTEKSDVYSFGVVLMELVSSLPAVDIMRHRHEINLSTMAINKILSDALHELVDQHLGFGSDYNTTKMIAAVAELGFQCLQNGKDMRPSMAEILQALENIQKEYSDADKLEKNDVHSDDVAMLKVDALALSPVSVAMQWVSSECTTPNASG